MTIRRVAIIFDDHLRPETTGNYCLDALKQLLLVEHIRPIDLHRVSSNEFDAFIYIDDGLRYELPSDLRPAVFWAIDTHIDFDGYRERVSDADYVFAAQRNGAERLTGEGIAEAEWLPLACHPKAHRPMDVPKKFDFCFVGNMFPGPRHDLVEALRSRYPDSFVGQAYFDEMARVYSSSRVAFNRSMRDDVNMRVFEALSCGSFLLTNNLAANGQEELLRPSVHLDTYSDRDELLEKCEFYLRNADVRERIAVSGLAEIVSKHTYRHRMLHVLQRLEGSARATPVAAPRAAGVRADERLQDCRAAEPAVSACILTWKRHENAKLIVRSLLQKSYIREILVWNNNPDRPFEMEGRRIRVVNAEQNDICFARFMAARVANHEFIYTQDDDCLVRNIDELYDEFCRDESRIVHGLKLGHLIRENERIFGRAHMALLGWGAFFKKEWTSVFDSYTRRFGHDRVLFREADRIFSMLQHRPHHAILARVSDLPGFEDEDALSVEASHKTLVGSAIERCLQLLGCEASTVPGESVGQRVEDLGEARQSDQRNLAPGVIERPTAPVRHSEAGINANYKDPFYFAHARRDILELVPRTARRVLDIGCASGRLGESLKQRQNCHVTGIEIVDSAAMAAERVLDVVHTRNVEDADIDFGSNAFDCIVCGDVVEHLRAPGSFLRRVRRWLSSDGSLIASIPNVRSRDAICDLLAGNWTYESAGLLDDTHLQFFTRRDAMNLFREADYEVRSCHLVPGAGYREWLERGKPSTIRMGSLAIEGLPPNQVEEFFAEQFLFSLVPQASIRQPEFDREASAGEPAKAPVGALRGTKHSAFEDGKRQEESPRVAAHLGCVLAVRNKSGATLERTLQTYAFQSVQPIDRVLLDYGSDTSFSDTYKELCDRYEWRLVRVDPEEPKWYLAKAYNLAIAALSERVEVVFKSDVDILLGSGILDAADALGSNAFCRFPYFTTTKDVEYPVSFKSAEQVTALRRFCPKSVSSVGQGIFACPRKWFTSVGGFDLNYRHWGYDDVDLRARAEASIEVRELDHNEHLLIHQWHKPTREAHFPDANRPYFEDMRKSGPIVRNRQQVGPRAKTPVSMSGAESGASAPQVNGPAKAVSNPSDQLIRSVRRQRMVRQLRFLYLGNFKDPNKMEQAVASILESLGHRVTRRHDSDVPSPDCLVEEANGGQHDCLLFHKGCIGARSLGDVLQPTGDAIAEVIKRSNIPCYTWYCDRAYQYDFDPSGELWMRKVAPLCRVAFVSDGQLAATDWANWHVLRQGAHREKVRPAEVAESDRRPIAFVGQVYGERGRELGAIAKSFQVDIIDGVFDARLNAVLKSYKIILGLNYPLAPGYWGDRLYIVLGHGGFFLAPEIEGMREEGFLPDVHYGRRKEDPVADIRDWLERPADRDRIARAGQAHVLAHHTTQHRVEKMCRVIASTLD